VESASSKPTHPLNTPLPTCVLEGITPRRLYFVHLSDVSIDLHQLRAFLLHAETKHLKFTRLQATAQPDDDPLVTQGFLETLEVVDLHNAVTALLIRGIPPNNRIELKLHSAGVGIDQKMWNAVTRDGRDGSVRDNMQSIYALSLEDSPCFYDASTTIWEDLSISAVTYLGMDDARFAFPEFLEFCTFLSNTGSNLCSLRLRYWTVEESPHHTS